MTTAPPRSLTEIYVDELQDLWSANEQMQRTLHRFEDRATDPRLRKMLVSSQAVIARHTETLKKLLAGVGGDATRALCRGMEGLAQEAIRHVLEEGPEPGPHLDVLIIAQYQRMTHYGIAGFGTAAAFALALNRERDYEKLGLTTMELYKSDEWMTKLAERSVNLRSQAATTA